MAPLYGAVPFFYLLQIICYKSTTTKAKCMGFETQYKINKAIQELSQLADETKEKTMMGHKIHPSLLANKLSEISDMLSDSNEYERQALIAKLSEQQQVGTDGFVRLVDVMGTDQSIVQAARTSYGKGTKQVSEDRNLIRYLMRHWHTTPFEMCEIKLHVRVPMDIWRQWVRHRTASVNEYSTRYSEAIDSRNTTLPEEWRLQSKSNKQGSAGLLVGDGAIKPKLLSDLEKSAHETALRAYEGALEAGVAREQARKNLPLSTYTEAYWKVDLHNLFHFLRLRLHPHAQQEIREFAEAIANIVSQLFPIAWEAFEDYRLWSEQFSAQELSWIREAQRSRSTKKFYGTSWPCYKAGKN
jgi:thymidylate synthase (FAD)